MPWFVPKATLAEAIDKWVNVGGFLQKHKIGRWPHPNTNRTDSRFIMLTDRDLAHTAHKRLWCWNLANTIDPVDFPPWQNLGWFDLEANGNSDVRGTSNTNEFGWVCHEEIKYVATLPVAGVEGVEVMLELTHAASGHFIRRFFEFVPGTNVWHWDRDTNPNNDPPDRQEESVNFPYVDVAQFEWAMSDCFLFPRDLPPVAGFARFDGIDSYIENRSVTLNTNIEWRQEFDVRLHGTGDHLYLAKSFNTTKFCLIRQAAIIYRGRIVTFSTSLNLDQWYHVDFRYEWDSPDGLYRVSVDGGADDTFASSGVADRWNRYGKKGASPVIGEFDLRNFVLTNGPSSTPVVFLDQKFDANACDDGPDARHGDTFFMSLPSCP